MSSVLSLPTVPLSEERAALLLRLTEGLDGESLWWLSGYAAGLAQRGAVAPGRPGLASSTETAPGQRLSIVYGSQTGNARRLAEQLAQQAETAGLAVRLLRADSYPLRELASERLLYVVISTQGDGDPPDDARGFVEHLLGKRVPALKALKFAVLGLGDSSYPKFNEVGRLLDARLAELGGSRLSERGEADLDIETVAAPWLARALEQAREQLKGNAPLATVTPLRPPPAAPAGSRERPFAAELLANQRITGRGSNRDIRHLEISLVGSGLSYEPGDALGVWPVNPPDLVDAVLAAIGADGDAAISHAGETLSLHRWLAEKRELTRLARPFLPATGGHAGDQLLDVLRRERGDWSAETLVAALRPLVPRLYSIASSQKVVGDEAHLTVAHVEYAHAGETRWGSASHFLAGAGDGARLPVYIERNERFHLPRDSSRDLIMIGPGTGIAPFRGFVQDRVADGARGRHWLVFGNPHARSDFLYQLEWQRALKHGQLQRLDLAFSRDQAQKIYVQQRLRERGRELFDWLENGAHLYVCGDATRMAKDVHAVLLEVIALHGGRDADGAVDYLNALQQQGRYARDVY